MLKNNTQKLSTKPENMEENYSHWILWNLLDLGDPMGKNIGT